jgi:hypothetical protein
VIIFSAQSPPRYFLITHGRRQKDMEGSGPARDKTQGELRCHNITLLQDCDISGAYPKAGAMKIILVVAYSEPAPASGGVTAKAIMIQQILGARPIRR